MKKLKQFYSVITVTTTFMVTFFIILNAFMPKTITVAYLRLFLVIGLIASVIGTSLFTKGLSPKSLWLRRTAICAVLLVVSLTIMVSFDLVSLNSFSEYAKFILITAISSVLFGIISFYITDKIEKKLLEKINSKLNEK